MNEFAHLDKDTDENEELARALLEQAARQQTAKASSDPGAPWVVHENDLMTQLTTGETYRPPAGSSGYGKVDGHLWAGPDGRPAAAKHLPWYERLADIGNQVMPANAPGMVAGVAKAGETVLGAGAVRANKALADAVEGSNSVASKTAALYNPPQKPARPFEADYPSGAVHDPNSGRLLKDPEGRDLSLSAHIAGRRMVGGGDEAIPAEEFGSIAKGLTGQDPKGAAQSNAPGGLRGNAGLLTVDRRSGPQLIQYDRSLRKEQAERVVGHEISHAIDEIAGQIPTEGLNDQLRAVYNNLNNPQNYGKPWGPEQHKYKGPIVHRELVAEAIRAYMADPNYIKTVAPDVAKAIRAAVNSNPKLKDTIQFNAVAPGPGALADALDRERSRD